MNRQNKFYRKNTRSFSQKAREFAQSMLFWKGRFKGMIHTNEK
jgi:hypothetical protein